MNRLVNRRDLMSPSCTLRRNFLPGRSISVTQQTAVRRTDRSSLTVKAQVVSVKEKALSAIPYILPLFDGIKYGKFLIVAYPALFRLVLPLVPLLQLYYAVPFAPIVTFFAIYFGIVRNMEVSRFVRYNAMQAVILDILIIVPQIFETAFSGVGSMMGGLGQEFEQVYYNTVFIFVFASFAYGVGASLTGQVARIPLVADAAEQQVPM